MRKILLITQDEDNTEQNHELFHESLDFIKNIAKISDISYSQLANFKYKNGLLKNMVTTYIDSCNFSRSANLIFDTPTNISVYNKIFPKSSNEEFYRDVFAGRNGISISQIRKMKPVNDYHSKINTSYFFGTTPELICNNFDYVVLHHGASNIVYYFSALNRELTSDLSEPRNLEKMILVNHNNVFNNLIEQYKSFKDSGIEPETLHPSICVKKNLSSVLDLLSQDRVYKPKENNAVNFTID